MLHLVIQRLDQRHGSDFYDRQPLVCQVATNLRLDGIQFIDAHERFGVIFEGIRTYTSWIFRQAIAMQAASLMCPVSCRAGSHYMHLLAGCRCIRTDAVMVVHISDQVSVRTTLPAAAAPPSCGHPALTPTNGPCGFLPLLIPEPEQEYHRCGSCPTSAYTGQRVIQRRKQITDAPT